jgi:hypothetical protein
MEQTSDYTSDIELDDQQTYDWIDQENTDEILAELGLTNKNEEANPNNRGKQEQQDKQQAIEQPDNENLESMQQPKKWISYTEETVLPQLT